MIGSLGWSKMKRWHSVDVIDEEGVTDLKKILFSFFNFYIIFSIFIFFFSDFSFYSNFLSFDFYFFLQFFFLFLGLKKEWKKMEMELDLDPWALISTLTQNEKGFRVLCWRFDVWDKIGAWSRFKPTTRWITHPLTNHTKDLKKNKSYPPRLSK